jgi:DNA-binding response OmpR family regulator
MSGGVKWRIMIVDDDQAFLNLAVEILATEFEAFGASNGLDALEKVERCEPDLILLDVSMPCVDGIDTCRAIRKNVRFRDVPVVFISGQDETHYKTRAKGLGAAHFLHKPVAPPHLLQCCREVLRQLKAGPSAHKHYSITELESLHPDSGEQRPIALVAPTQIPDLDQTPTAVRGVSAPATGQTLARILIVDDSPEVIGLMLSALRDRFEAFGVRDPVSAIYKIIRYQPDLLILEAAMPRMSGYQLSQLLRLNPNLRTISVLFVLSKSGPQEIAYAQKLGAADYVVKPIQAEELLRTVTAITEAPDFVIREKALSFEDIRRAESTDSAPSQFS